VYRVMRLMSKKVDGPAWQSLIEEKFHAILATSTT
jgi:hypothetical protein